MSQSIQKVNNPEPPKNLPAKDESGRWRPLTSIEQDSIIGNAVKLTQAQAAHAAGIKPKHLNAAFRNNPSFRERWDKAIAEQGSRVANTLINSAEAGDSMSAQFLLKTRFGWREENVATKLSDLERLTKLRDTGGISKEVFDAMADQIAGVS